MSIYQNKKVLVTGGTGMIGRPLVKRLIEEGASVRVASLDNYSSANREFEFIRTDLTRLDNCLKVCEGMNYVFHLVGVKGSPKVAQEKPASFFVPLLQFNTNMLEAARLSKVERYLYTSTIGVYAPAEVFYEDDVWKTFPSENDKFAGWAKRMGELQAEAYNIEYKMDKISIVRPANVYGPYDNFDGENSMVIPSLIKRVVKGENPLRVWGDGSQIRDFIHARDVAEGMLLTVEKGISYPINLGSGVGCSIKEIAELITKNADPSTEISWDESKPSGDKKRLMDITKAREIGFSPRITLEEGIKETIDWYRRNMGENHRRYDVFAKNS